MANVIEIHDVSQEFISGNNTASVLQNINFSIKQQSFTIIYGQSGSGKSTMLNILSGLQKPTKGSVTIEGEQIYGYSFDQLAKFRANTIGIVYQTNYWVKSLSVIENVALPLLFLGESLQAAKHKARKALDNVGMLDLADRQTMLLSGGEQQRVAVARAIINKPNIIIADEPTGNLDTQNGDKVVKLLQDYTKINNATVVMVTHNLEYLPVADHLLHIQDGAVEDLKSSNYKLMTKSLMDDMQKRIELLAKTTTSKEAKK